MTTDMDELGNIVGGLASYFAGEPGVQAAWLFGSHAEGRSHRESDVDVAVLLEHGRFPEARARFEVRVAMTADLIAVLHRNEVDLVVLNDAPPPVRPPHRSRRPAGVLRGRGRRACVSPGRPVARGGHRPFLERMRGVKLEAISR